MSSVASVSSLEATVNHLKAYCGQKSVEQKSRQDRMITAAIAISSFCLLIFSGVLSTLTIGMRIVSILFTGMCAEGFSKLAIILKDDCYQDRYKEAQEALGQQDFPAFASQHHLLTPDTILQAHKLFKEQKEKQIWAARQNLSRA